MCILFLNVFLRSEGSHTAPARGFSAFGRQLNLVTALLATLLLSVERTRVILFTFSAYCASKTSARDTSLPFSPSHLSLPRVIAKNRPFCVDDAGWSSLCQNYIQVCDSVKHSFTGSVCPPKTLKGQKKRSRLLDKSRNPTHRECLLLSLSCRGFSLSLSC